MTTSSRKSFNHLALKGSPVDDMEFVEKFNLDPSVAYSNKINEVMLQQTYDENLSFYREQGLTDNEARDKAMKNRRAAEKDLKVLLAKNGMLK